MGINPIRCQMPKWEIQIDGITPARGAYRRIRPKPKVQLGILVNQAIRTNQPASNKSNIANNNSVLFVATPFRPLATFSLVNRFSAASTIPITLQPPLAATIKY
jgi:hypothetical protein